MAKTSSLREWAKTKDVLALKRIAKDEGMLGVHTAKKAEVINWLMSTRLGQEALAESYRIETEALRAVRDRRD